MEADEASLESTARSPNSFFRSASCEERMDCQFRARRGVHGRGNIGERTRYVLGSCGIRFRMSVVFPLPRKPVIMVTGTGDMLAADGLGQL
jgi:hypothetical protein